MTDEPNTETAAPAARNTSNLRAFAIVLGGLNVLAAAAAIFGAIVYIGEANDRQLQRDTFEALAVEMLYARLDRARETRSNASDVLHRLNGYGVRMRDIESGLDRQMQASTRLDQLFPGVRIDAPADSGDSAVQLGGTDILSFTPDGTSTSGTVQILGRDGSRFAVRVFGVTGRVRVLQFDDRSRGWMELL